MKISFKKHDKTALFFLFISILIVPVMVTGQDTNLENKIKQLEKYYSDRLKEKLYLRFDKAVYRPGENLFFKGYLVEPHENHIFLKNSRLYLKILDEKGKERMNKSFAIKRGQIQNKLEIPKSLDEGIYNLVAFTKEMKKGHLNYVFRKNIMVISDLLPTFFIMAKVSGNASKNIQTSVNLLSRDLKPIPDCNIEFALKSGESVIKSGKVKSNHAGKLLLPFELSGVSSRSMMTLSLKASHEGRVEQRTIPLNQASVQEISIYPESGDFIAGTPTKVVVRAQDQLARPVAGFGELLDSQKSIITRFEINPDGFGQFTFSPESGKFYTIQIQDDNGVKTVHELPPIKKHGMYLRLAGMNRGHILFNLQGNFSSERRFYSIAHMRGQVYWAADFTLEDTLSFEIPVSKFPTGITEITIFDSTGVVYAKRLVFVDQKDRLQVNINPDKKVYKNGEIASVKVLVFDKFDNLLPFQFSLSVQPDLGISHDSGDDIFSYLFLNSDLAEFLKFTDTPDGDSSQSVQRLNELLIANDLNVSFWTDSQIPHKKDKDFDKALASLFKLNWKQRLLNRLMIDSFKYRENWQDENQLARAKLISDRFSSTDLAIFQGDYMPQWKRHITTYGILEAIKYVKPYQLIGSRIFFRGISSVNNPKGALIVLDGLKLGYDVRVLTGINPYDVDDIKVYTSAAGILQYDSFATDGVVEIITKGSSRKETNQLLIYKQTMKHPIWSPDVRIDDSGEMRFQFYTPNLELPMIGIIEGLTEDGNPGRALFRFSVSHE